MGQIIHSECSTGPACIAWRAGFVALLLLFMMGSCGKPTEFTEFTNPYDELSPNFITHPDLNTLSVHGIRAQEAWSGGEFTSDYGRPVTAKGVCWASEQNPTTGGQCTNEGGGLEAFESRLSNLEPDQVYYVRAYATNADTTIYGGQREFRTYRYVFLDVTNPATGRTWMDRNLGALRAATSATDEQAYGDLYQWGRGADGHQNRNSPTTTTISSTDLPGHGSFIVSGSDANWDWRTPQNNNLWQGINGTNNPCPQGFRIPTQAEWDTERQSWSSNNAAGAFTSPLKLTLAGRRDISSGMLRVVDSDGYYWADTVTGTNAQLLYFDNSDASMDSFGRARGYSVRCIKD